MTDEIGTRAVTLVNGWLVYVPATDWRKGEDYHGPIRWPAGAIGKADGYIPERSVMVVETSMEVPWRVISRVRQPNQWWRWRVCGDIERPEEDGTDTSLPDL